MTKKQIYREGVWYYVGVPGEFKRTRTGANRRGFLNAIKLMRMK
tara:strand:+ start:1032 stop:1163 length:132 start_codon:yes stop_codon:yes gene_type:complete